MALNQVALSVLRGYLPGAGVLCLGKPELITSGGWIRERYGVEVVGLGSEADARRHTTGEVRYPDTDEFFAKLGCRVRYVDVVGDDYVDLNEPAELGLWDVVIDPGTVEHCFNIGVAMLNCAGAVRGGGVIFHCVPMSMFNHGFYNICPTMMYDFYRQNGWEILRLAALDRMGRLVKMSLKYRFDAVSDVCLYVLAKRVGMERLRYPVQSKYIEMAKNA